MTRRRLTLAALVAAAGSGGSAVATLVATSCGPVAAPPAPPVPLNACPANSCSQSAGPALCVGGMCTATTSFDFTLLVSLPSSVTIPIESFDAASQSGACGQESAPANAVCLQLPSLLQATGSMLVQGSVVGTVEAGAYIDTSVGGPWSLPVAVQFRPLWPLDPSTSDGGAPVLVEATAVGLPLYAVDAFLTPWSTSNSAPRGGIPTQWVTPLVPGLYERDVVPQNDAFPVLTTSPVTATNNPDSENLAGLDTSAGALTVTRPDASLEGFSVFVRDATTLRRVSSRVTFATATPGSVQINTIRERPLSKTATRSLQLVVTPPDGTPIPYLADPIIQDQLGPNEPFPDLPSPVAVSGTVVGPDQTPVGATLIIDSMPGAITLNGLVNSAGPFMHYSTAVQTDAAGAFKVTLPPGKYDVFVTPAAGANAGAASVELDVGVPLLGEPPIAAGKTLVASPLSVLAGGATLIDGRPLAGATVEAHAAASLASTLDPRRWPRTQTTTTDAAGAFAMVVDPGTYDLVLQPAGGSGFPWTTLSTQSVVAGATLQLPPMGVPAPTSTTLVLSYPGNAPVSQALVRAFAPAATALPVAPGGPRPMIEIGQWITDPNGQVTMLLAPPQ